MMKNDKYIVCFIWTTITINTTQIHDDNNLDKISSNIIDILHITNIDQNINYKSIECIELQYMIDNEKR